MAKRKLLKGPVSRLAVSRNTKLAEGAVDKITKEVKSIPSDIQMTMDAFNVVHARIALSGGVGPVSDPSYVREKLFEIISTVGWEATVVLLASCARLFAEVPAPVPPLNKITKQFLHQLAQDLDARGQPMRHVDREIVTRKVRS